MKTYNLSTLEKRLNSAWYIKAWRKITMIFRIAIY
jgi:hypothetical protein